jgi:hypothetical protein
MNTLKTGQPLCARCDDLPWKPSSFFTGVFVKDVAITDGLEMQIVLAHDFRYGQDVTYTVSLEPLQILSSQFTQRSVYPLSKRAEKARSQTYQLG